MASAALASQVVCTRLPTPTEFLCLLDRRERMRRRYPQRLSPARRVHQHGRKLQLHVQPGLLRQRIYLQP